MGGWKARHAVLTVGESAGHFGRTLSRLVLGGMLTLMPVATLLPSTAPPSDMASSLHFVALACAAFLACLGFRSYKLKLGAVLAVFLLSALMESLQHVLPYRHGSWSDVWINAQGCVAGVGVYCVLDLVAKVQRSS